MEALLLMLALAIVLFPLASLPLSVFGLVRSHRLRAQMREQSASIGLLESTVAELLARTGPPAEVPTAEPPTPTERTPSTARSAEVDEEPELVELPTPPLAALRDETTTADQTTEAASTEESEPAEAPVETEPAEEQSIEPSDRETGAPSWRGPSIEERIAAIWREASLERMVVWLASAMGGLTLLLASLLGLALAIDKGLLGPVPRVVGGITIGSLLFAGSTLPRRKGLRWIASALGGSGLGMLYAALAAATSLYDMLPNPVGFALLCGVTLTAFLRADRDQDRFLAGLGLLGGLLTPFFVSSGNNSAIALFAYLTLLMAGTVETVRRRDWPELLALALLGAGLHYLGWSMRWHVADQAPIGLLAPLFLVLPLLRVPRETLSPRSVLGLGALALGPLAAVFWLVPVDPVFTDPVTGLTAMRPLGLHPWLAAVAVSLLSLPMVAVGRKGLKDPALSAMVELGGVACSAALMLIFATGWGTLHEPPLGPLLLGVFGPAVPMLLLTRKGDHAAAAFPVALAMGLSILLGGTELELLHSLAPIGLLGLSMALAFRTRSPVAMPATLAASALVAWLSMAQLEAIGGIALAGPTVAAYASITALPLFWKSSEHPAVGWWTSAAAGPILFLPLWAAWREGLGEAFIGLLPVAMSAVALLATRLLLKAHELDKQSTLIAVFASVALAGVTLALPLQIDEAWLTIGWSLEVAALAALTRRLHHPIIRAAGLGLAAVVGARLLLNPYSLMYGDSAGLPVLNWTLYTWGVPALALLAGAWLLAPTRRAEPWATAERAQPLVYVLLAIAVGFALVNVQVSHAFTVDGPLQLVGRNMLQGMVRSVSWAGFGLLILMAGLFANSRVVRFTGFGFVLLAAGKVFLVDLWGLHGVMRFGSVLGLGISLLIAAFLFERLVLRAPATSTGRS